jgi:hypothetical protein
MIARREQKAAERWSHFVHFAILNLFAFTHTINCSAAGRKHHDAERNAGDEPAADRGAVRRHATPMEGDGVTCLRCVPVVMQWARSCASKFTNSSGTD